MTPEEQHPEVDGRTARAARIALSKKTISRESYDAVFAGTLSLADAKRLGRSGAPDAPDATEGIGTATETPPEPSPPLCWCGCLQEVRPGRRWLQGHDARGKSLIQKAVTESKISALSETLREYVKERGLI